MEPLRVGVLGVREGMQYLRACRDCPDVVLAGICDRDTEQLGTVAQRFEVPLAVTDDERFLTHEGLDAVIVATPDRQHRNHIVAALEAGLHVFCLPPMVLRLEDGLSLVAAVARYPDQRVMVGHAARHHPFFVAARELVMSGEIGEVYAARIAQFAAGTEYGDPGSWRLDPKTGTHPLLAIGLEAVDLAGWLAGDLTRVTARSLQRALMRLPFDDTISARFETAPGGLAEVFLAVGAHRSPSLRLEVLGTEGAICGDAAARQNSAWMAKGGETRRQELPGDPSATGIPAAVADFVSAIREGRRPSVQVTDGHRACAAALAAIASAESGETIAIDPGRTAAG